MPSITVLRNKLNLRDGSRKVYRVFFAKNKVRDNIKKIFDVLVESQVLEGDDRVICKHGKRVTHDYFLCISCCCRAQIEGSKYCKTCAAKTKKPQQVPPAGVRIVGAQEKNKKKLPVIQNNKPHPNAKYYKY